MRDKFFNKKGIIIIGIVVVIVLLIFLIVILNKENQEKELNNKLKNMGIDFYENYYYDNLGEDSNKRIEFLKKFEAIGIKIDINNLARYNSEKNSKIVDEFVNNKTKKKCDGTNTKVIIYPQKPYGKSNYKIETILDCGFKKDDK